MHLIATSKQVCCVTPGIAPSQIEHYTWGPACSATFSDKEEAVEWLHCSILWALASTVQETVFKRSRWSLKWTCNQTDYSPTSFKIQVLLNETGTSKSHSFTLSYGSDSFEMVLVCYCEKLNLN